MGGGGTQNGIKQKQMNITVFEMHNVTTLKEAK